MFKPQDLYIPVSEEPGSYDDRTINFHKRTENLLEEKIIYVIPKNTWYNMFHISKRRDSELTLLLAWRIV